MGHGEFLVYWLAIRYMGDVDVDVFPVCFCPKSILCGAVKRKQD